MSEPIQGGSEQHEGEESDGELFVAGGDAPELLNAPKEVFDVVAMPVVTAMEAGWMPAALSGRNAAPGVLCAQIGTESIGVEALVGHDPVTAQTPPQWSHGEQVVLRAGGQGDRNRPAMLVRDGGELGVQSAFGPTDGLRQLAARGIGPVLMQLDVRAIQVPQPTFGAPGQSRQQTVPQTTRCPAPPARVDRTPRAVLCRHISPRTTGAQHIPNRRHHDPIINRRPTPNCAIMPSPRISPTQLNFFSRFHSGCANSNRLGYIIVWPPTRLALAGSTRFEYTP